MSEEAKKEEFTPWEIFQNILACEESLASAKSELQKATVLFGNVVAERQTALDTEWKSIEAYMASTGEYELDFPAPAGQRYVVNWSTPRQSVKIVDDAAVPDEFCRIKREPDKKKIKEELESGKAHNWASLEYGEKRLQWKTVKSKGE